MLWPSRPVQLYWVTGEGGVGITETGGREVFTKVDSYCRACPASELISELKEGISPLLSETSLQLCCKVP